MKHYVFVLACILCNFFGIYAQSSFPPKTYPSSIKVETDAGVALFWDVKRIMCVGPANGGYKFRIYGKAAADHSSRTVDMWYILPSNKLQSAGAYQFPAVKAGQSFNFEIVSAFKGHAPQKFLGFLIKDEWLKAPEENDEIEVPEVPEEVLATIRPSQIALVDESSVSTNNDEITSKDIEITQKDIDEIFTNVDENAEFPGGMRALSLWLGENISYPKAAKNNNVQGKVIVKFVIEKNGAIGQVSIFKGVDKDLDQEAMRLVKSMPRWKPGKKDGENVRCWFNLPINFRLS